MDLVGVRTWKNSLIESMNASRDLILIRWVVVLTSFDYLTLLLWMELNTVCCSLRKNQMTSLNFWSSEVTVTEKHVISTGLASSLQVWATFSAECSNFWITQQRKVLLKRTRRALQQKSWKSKINSSWTRTSLSSTNYLNTISLVKTKRKCITTWNVPSPI